jgi:ferric iron reductase protein FhuF
MRSMQEGLSAKLQDQFNDKKHSEDRDMVYLDRLLETHQDDPLTRLLGLRDDEVLFYIFLQFKNLGAYEIQGFK